jgi:hypothetical protein
MRREFAFGFCESAQLNTKMPLVVGDYCFGTNFALSSERVAEVETIALSASEPQTRRLKTGFGAAGKDPVMRRILLALAVMGTLAFTCTTAEAHHGYYGHHGYGHYGGYRGYYGYRGPAFYGYAAPYYAYPAYGYGYYPGYAAPGYVAPGFGVSVGVPGFSASFGYPGYRYGYRGYRW